MSLSKVSVASLLFSNVYCEMKQVAKACITLVLYVGTSSIQCLDNECLIHSTYWILYIMSIYVYVDYRGYEEVCHD